MVDALCIDQTTVEERGCQFKQTQKIYSAVQEVVVWLGESTDLSDHAIELVTLTREALRKEGHHYKRIALDELFARPYWIRVWVVQELAAAEWTRRACTIRCGTKSFTLAQLKDFVRRMFRSTNIIPSKALMRPKALLSLSTQHHNKSFLNVLWVSSGLLATEDRDRIYGIRGISPAFYRDNIDVDYTIGFERLCSRVMMLMIKKERNLDVLCSFHRCISQSSLPSWLRDFRKRNPGIAPSMYSADNGRKAKAEIKNDILRTFGVCIGSVDKVVVFNKTSRKDPRIWKPKTNLGLQSELRDIELLVQKKLPEFPRRGRGPEDIRFLEMMVGGKQHSKGQTEDDYRTLCWQIWDKRVAFE
jgi:hypothetical protein